VGVLLKGNKKKNFDAINRGEEEKYRLRLLIAQLGGERKENGDERSVNMGGIGGGEKHSIRTPRLKGVRQLTQG